MAFANISFSHMSSDYSCDGIEYGDHYPGKDACDQAYDRQIACMSRLRGYILARMLRFSLITQLSKCAKILLSIQHGF